MLCSVTLPSLDHDLKLVEQRSPLNHVMRMTNVWTHSRLLNCDHRFRAGAPLSMSFLLPRVLKRRSVAPPQHGMLCPAALTAVLNHNKLFVDQTITNGNCGLDAFGQALLDLSKRDRCLSNRNKYKQFSKSSKTTDSMVIHLRQEAIAWMSTNKDTPMWDGMSFGQVALAMQERGRSLTYNQYLANMQQDRCWIDCAVIHALCCVYKVDALVFQPGMEPTIVGPSLLESGSMSENMLTLALVNDHHFWAVKPAPLEVLPEPPENGDATIHYIRKT